MLTPPHCEVYFTTDRSTFSPCVSLTLSPYRERLGMNDVRQGLERTHCIRFMEILNRQFGLVIAYLLPGFIALAGLAPLVPVVAGMVVSCFRWFLIDRIHSLTGVPAAAFNARALEDRPMALNFLIENHYRYYQFYANALIAVIWSYTISRLFNTSYVLGFATDIGTLILCIVLFAGSRDALIKYRTRRSELSK